jgi:hypothetical protein
VEVTLSAAPTARDARHLARMRDRTDDRFGVGLVLHAGGDVLPLGDRLWAVPFSVLWRED